MPKAGVPRKVKSAKPQQSSLYPPGRGGRRKGAGRKPNGVRAGVHHVRRAPLGSHHPVHVTVRMKDIRTLRQRRCYRVVRAALSDGSRRRRFRVVEFSVMTNHVHLLCEAADRKALSRGLQGLLIRIARGLNRNLGRSGTVFADRYHDRVLTTPSEVRNALHYVLNNAHKHAAERGGKAQRGWLDPCSSALSFTGWRGRVRQAGRTWNDDFPELARARSWLLRVGWRRAGPALAIDGVPGRSGRR